MSENRKQEILVIFIINPLQIRFIAGDDEESDTKETDCPLAKHLGFLEAFFKTAFVSINEKEF